MVGAGELGTSFHYDYKEDLWYYVWVMKESNYKNH